jgi:hypothetical protein
MSERAFLQIWVGMTGVPLNSGADIGLLTSYVQRPEIASVLLARIHMYQLHIPQSSPSVPVLSHLPHRSFPLCYIRSHPPPKRPLSASYTSWLIRRRHRRHRRRRQFRDEDGFLGGRAPRRAPSTVFSRRTVWGGPGVFSACRFPSLWRHLARSFSASHWGRGGGGNSGAKKRNANRVVALGTEEQRGDYLAARGW